MLGLPDFTGLDKVHDPNTLSAGGGAGIAIALAAVVTAAGLVQYFLSKAKTHGPVSRTPLYATAAAVAFVAMVEFIISATTTWSYFILVLPLPGYSIAQIGTLWSKIACTIYPSGTTCYIISRTDDPALLAGFSFVCISVFMTFFQGIAFIRCALAARSNGGGETAAVGISAFSFVCALIGVVASGARGNELTPSTYSRGYGLGFGVVALIVTFLLLIAALAFKMIKPAQPSADAAGAKYAPGAAAAAPAVIYVPTVQQPAAVAQAV